MVNHCAKDMKWQYLQRICILYADFLKIVFGLLKNSEYFCGLNR